MDENIEVIENINRLVKVFKIEVVALRESHDVIDIKELINSVISNSLYNGLSMIELLVEISKRLIDFNHEHALQLTVRALYMYGITPVMALKIASSINESDADDLDHYINKILIQNKYKKGKEDE